MSALDKAARELALLQACVCLRQVCALLLHRRERWRRHRRGRQPDPTAVAGVRAPRREAQRRRQRLTLRLQRARRTRLRRGPRGVLTNYTEAAVTLLTKK